MTEQSFEVTYAQMSDGELAKVLRDERDLVPELPRRFTSKSKNVMSPPRNYAK